MARSYWLSQRALKLQNSALADDELSSAEQEKQLSLFIRYQATHDRAFRNALTDLLKLRSERRKAGLDEAALCKRAEDVKIGFESRKRADAIVTVRQSAENRKQERHKWDVLLAQAKLDHQMILNSNLEIDREIAAASQIHAHEPK